MRKSIAMTRASTAMTRARRSRADRAGDAVRALDDDPTRGSKRDLVFETERLRVRRWCASDQADLVAVYGDADAVRWVGDGQPITEDRCRRWLEVTRGTYEQRGYGMFAVERKAEPGVIGFWGIVHPGGQEVAEVKYAYLRRVWGEGIASEALVGLIAYGVRVHGIARMIATTAPENAASRRVLLEAGMRRGELRSHDDGGRTQVFLQGAHDLHRRVTW